MTLREAGFLCGEARVAIRTHKLPVKARELVEQVFAALERLEGPPTELAELHASLANTFNDLEDARAESMIVRAIELEARSEPSRPIILGTHKLFYARWLLAHERWSEAKAMAFDGIETYARGVPETDPELARVELDAARIVVKAREHEPD